MSNDLINLIASLVNKGKNVYFDDYFGSLSIYADDVRFAYFASDINCWVNMEVLSC